MNLHGIRNCSVRISFIILILDPPYARDPDVPTSPMNFPRGWGVSPNVPYVHLPSPLLPHPRNLVEHCLQFIQNIPIFIFFGIAYINSPYAMICTGIKILAFFYRKYSWNLITLWIIPMAKSCMTVNGMIFGCCISGDELQICQICYV